MEATTYVEINEYGSAVVAGTRIHVDAIGYAHEGGSTEAELLEWFNIDRVQLYGALAYFYQNREGLQQKIDERIDDAIEKGILKTNVVQRLRQNLRDNKS